MEIDHHKEILKLTFPVLALLQNESIGWFMVTTHNPQFLILLRLRANAGNDSFRISLWWPIHIITPVDKTKLFCDTPTYTTPQFLRKCTPHIHLNISMLNLKEIKET